MFCANYMTNVIQYLIRPGFGDYNRGNSIGSDKERDAFFCLACDRTTRGSDKSNDCLIFISFSPHFFISNEENHKITSSRIKKRVPVQSNGQMALKHSCEQHATKLTKLNSILINQCIAASETPKQMKFSWIIHQLLR